MTENTNNIYDTANQLERDLRALPAFEALKTSLDTVNANEESKELFDKFRALTQELQMKQMQGQQPTEEDMEKMQTMSTQISADENIAKLMQAEQQLSQVINDINEIIVKPIQEVYGD